MSSTWSMREAIATDAGSAERFLAGIDEFSETLRPSPGATNWRWLFVEENRVNAIVAEDRAGTMIAHYGLFPMPYRADEHDVVAGVASQLAVAAAYRKTSLALGLSSRLYAVSRRRSFGFVTGLANRAGLLEFHKAFGFRDVGEVAIYAKPIDVKAVARAILPRALSALLAPALAIVDVVWRARLRGSAGRSPAVVDIERIARFDDAIAATSIEIGRRHRFYARRDRADILNRRFFDNPSREYECHSIVREGRPVGYFVLRVMEMKGFRTVGIVDACFDLEDRAVARHVLRAIDRIAVERCAELVAMLTNSTSVMSLLRRDHFFKAPESFRLVVLEWDGSLGLKDSRLDDWFVTWFEHDYV